jgi:hypothetical protein
MTNRAIFLLGFIAITSASSLAGQSGKPRRAAAQKAFIEGDVYLMMQNGDTKKGAGLTINLLRDGEQLRKRLDRICFSHDSLSKELKVREDSPYKAYMDAVLDVRKERLRMEAKAVHDSLANETVATLSAVVFTLAQSAVGHSETGMNAHYSFSNIDAGRYIVFGEWTIGNNEYQWWAPVEIKAGQRLANDLNNSVEAKGKVYCGIK